MPVAIDQIMEDASQALARMDYLTCESKCLDALSQAREAGDWWSYARILLPLQEARRQRRLNAACGTIRLGTRSLTGDLVQYLDLLTPGGIIFTPPHSAEDARALHQLVRDQSRHAEVLYAPQAAPASPWTIASFLPEVPVSCRLDPPPDRWMDLWLKPDAAEPQHDKEDDTDQSLARTPADYLIDASEALGDAAIEWALAETDPVLSIHRLESSLRVVTDHEKIHQRLAELARIAARS